MKNWILLLLALPLVAFSCRKDIEEITTTQTTNQVIPEVRVIASLSGQVIGPDGEAISNAIVRVGNQATVTNETGIYQFVDITMNSRGTFVKVDLDGYFQGSDWLYPASGSKNTSTIRLIRKIVKGSVVGSQGGTVEVAGATIEFSANSIANSQGQVYVGEVQVAAEWLDPTADNLDEFMPGGLYGINEKGETVIMASLGMLAVELQDEAGNELNIATGRSATLRMPVPEELRANAPASIPLWHFDETDGIWLEEGSATLEGDTYVGEVQHFSYWNLDVPSETPLVFVTGCMVYDNGEIAANQGFRIVMGVDGLYFAFGVTDNEGVFQGYLPSELAITFELYDQCGQFASYEVGPFTADTDLLDCLVIPSPNTLEFSGRLLDCSNQPIANGVVRINWGWRVELILTDENGFFFQLFNDCSSNEVEVVGFDFSNMTSTEILSYTFSETLDVGNIIACDNPLDSYLNDTVDGTSSTFFDLVAPDTILFPDSFQLAPYYGVVGNGIITTDGEVNRIKIHLTDLSVGSYTGEDVRYERMYSNEALGETGFFYFCDNFSCDGLTVNITANGGPGGFLEGNYEGVVDGRDAMQQAVVDRPVSGDFRVRLTE